MGVPGFNIPPNVKLMLKHIVFHLATSNFIFTTDCWAIIV